jgi:hypothetical protein
LADDCLFFVTSQCARGRRIGLVRIPPCRNSGFATGDDDPTIHSDAPNEMKICKHHTDAGVNFFSLELKQVETAEMPGCVMNLC